MESLLDSPLLLVIGIATGLVALCLILAFSGRSLDGVMTAIVGVTSILLTVRVITANREAVAMLMKSRASEGNLAEVIARAPTGFVRINTDFAIIDANLQFSAILATADEKVIGFPITRYFSAEGGKRFVDLLEALEVGTVNTVDSVCGSPPKIGIQPRTAWIAGATWFASNGANT